MPGPADFYPRAPGQRPLAHGTISTRQPAPTAFTDPVYVVLDHDPDDAVRVVNWPVIHGATLPSPGADVLIGFDEYKTPHVLHWDGVYS